MTFCSGWDAISIDAYTGINQGATLLIAIPNGQIRSLVFSPEKYQIYSNPLSLILLNSSYLL